MADITNGKMYKLTAPYLVDGVDATIFGTAIWNVSSNEFASIETQVDGSALLTTVAAGVVTVDYTAKGMNASGEVPLVGTIDLNVVDVIVVEPVQVVINVEEVV